MTTHDYDYGCQAYDPDQQFRNIRLHVSVSVSVSVMVSACLSALLCVCVCVCPCLGAAAVLLWLPI